MSFVLEEVRLQRYVEGTVVVSPSLKVKTDNNEDQMEKIYT